MVATWKKGLFVLGVTTVVLAAPVMGIEVRHDNLCLISYRSLLSEMDMQAACRVYYPPFVAGQRRRWQCGSSMRLIANQAPGQS